jgi:hypothetical protein
MATIGQNWTENEPRRDSWSLPGDRAQRLNETLKPGETGILFLVMLHSMACYLLKISR